MESRKTVGIFFYFFVKENLKIKELRGDLIQFYNEVNIVAREPNKSCLNFMILIWKVYLKNMKTYVKLYISGENKTTPNLTLSPIPKIGMQTFSPRKVTENQSVYISPAKQQVQVQRPKLTWSYNNNVYQVNRKNIIIWLA